MPYGRTMVWSRAVAGVVLLASVAAAWLKSGEAIFAGHWAYPVWLGLVTVAGIVLLLWAWRGAPAPPGVLRAVLRWIVTAVAVAVAGLTWWLAPYPVQVADAAQLTTPPGVTVTDSSDGILLTPTDRRKSGTAGVAFLPGALVDPRAYIPLLTPVAQAGHPVFIAKLPLGVAFLEPDVVGAARAADPTTQDWVVAGHSLGGAVGSDQAVQGAAGLILLGAYPINDISSADIPVLSISGTNDGLTTPADVKASRKTLPDGTEFVIIPGAIHSYFGDYGEQPGDGQAAISRAEAQEQITQAMIGFLKQFND